MVDPTWKTECPACGYETDENQLGQLYGHRGVNGCPYSGNGRIQAAGVYPLKFDTDPMLTAAAAYVDDCDAATIRYECDIVPQHDFISLRDTDDDPHGIGRIQEQITGPLIEVFGHVWNAEGVRYGHEEESSLLAALNGYYSDEIGHQTEVTAVIYTPWLRRTFTDRMPIEDGV